MGLQLGTRLGPYEIQSAIGAGGMGEVYRARDTKLDRLVAIKILPESFALDPERLMRFEREAETLASLNHPNIAIVHGFEETPSTPALVMELVEGPTLADRIAQGPIPLEEALSIAKQIGEALEAAHAQGIVHRDLKPANIKLRVDGVVKVLDFGLAKIAALEESADSSLASTTTMHGTRIGTILGTAAYMSPEQTRGMNVSLRTDVWSFGCVLYEMLSGRSAFAGQTVPDTIAGILEREPNWQALPPSTPRAIQLLLRRCVRKDPQERFRSIAIVRSEIAAAHTRLSKRASRVRQLAMAAVVVALTILSLVMWNERSQSLPESRPSLPESRPIPPVIEAPIVPQRRPPRIAPARIPRISHRFVGDNPPAKPPISTLSPNYPAQAQSAGIEGVVVLDLVIGTDGRVQDADVIMGQVPVLAQAALDAVRQWRFEPTLVDDVAVPVTIRVEVQFTLQ